MEEILENLSDIQRQAVVYSDGPSLIIAGAGAGKTRVLTRKVAYLMQQGLAPWNICALTFTNKAAREMKERIAAMVDAQSARRLWMGTFHSIFLRILRAESSVLGFPADFSVYDTEDTKKLLKTIIKEMELPDKQYKPNVVYSRISNAKNDLVSPKDYAENVDYQQRDADTHLPRIAQIYARYEDRCRQAHAMDFDDILFYTNVLFRDHPDILAAYQERFKFILVDEYQDTNVAQDLIVRQLSARHHRVCVVGDDSQSIYSFRGANIDNILRFQKVYPECRLFKLEQNYRSTQNIVNIANSLIGKNRRQIRKNVYSEREKGSLTQIVSAFSDVEEAYMIATKVSELRLRTREGWNSFAVLYRTNAQSRLLEEAMRKRNIPYRVYGGMSFYQRKEVKDVIAYMRLTVNPQDEEAFMRVVNFPARGIGDTTLQRLSQRAAEAQVSVWEVLCRPDLYPLPVNNGLLGKLYGFRDLMMALRKKADGLNAYDFAVELLADTGLNRDLAADITQEGISRKDNVQALLAGMHDFCQSRQEEGSESVALADFLSEVSLLTDQDESDKAEGEKVTLMTVHAAKGLEFKNVVIAGMEENLFPLQFSVESEKELEEERRLLYVAITRAENNCILTYAKSRFKNGSTEYTRPSRFLRDLDPALLDMPGTGRPVGQTPSPALFGGAQGNFGGWRAGSASLPARPASGYPSKSTSSRPAYASPAARKPAYTPPAPSERKWSKLPSSAPAQSAADAAATSKGNFTVGQHVLHERFGEGIVKRIEGSGDNCKIGVEFTHAGFKLLLLRFANMKPL